MELKLATDHSGISFVQKNQATEWSQTKKDTFSFS
jgi:hypothetical protein